MQHLEPWVKTWDARIAEWIERGAGADMGCAAIRACYRGSGRKAVDEDAMPEPYVGEPLSGRLAGVALHLNPGAGMSAQTWPNGWLVDAVRRQGYHATYGGWKIPPGTAKWWARSGRCLKRLSGAHRCADQDVLGIDFFPWHSRSTGSLRPDREGLRWLDENVLRPAALAAERTAFGALTQRGLGVPAVLAVGKAFAALLEQLDFEVLDEAAESGGPSRFARWPRRGDGQPTARRLRVYRSVERGLAVLQTSAPGANTLPREAFDPILHVLLRAAA